MNAGNNDDIIVIYGSNDDGATWTEVAEVNVKSTYANYTTELTTGYTWLKLDVEGSKQVRIKSITLTTGEPCKHTNTTTTTVDATCTEAGSTTVTCDDCGVTVSTEEIAALGHTTDNGTCERCSEIIGGTSEPQVTTETLEVFGNTGTLASDSSEITWTGTDVTVVNTKGSTAIRTSDSDHFRLYANSGLTISVESGTISQIVITCTNSSYANVLAGSLETNGATATVNGSIVTVTVTTGNSVTFTLSAQSRISKVEVTYSK